VMGGGRQVSYSLHLSAGTFVGVPEALYFELRPFGVYFFEDKMGGADPLVLL